MACRDQRPDEVESRATRQRGTHVRPKAVRRAAKVLSGRKDLPNAVLSGRKDLPKTVLSGSRAGHSPALLSCILCETQRSANFPGGFERSVTSYSMPTNSDVGGWRTHRVFGVADDGAWHS